MIVVAADLARRRQARGLKLNYPEAIAIISYELVEGARFDIDTDLAPEAGSVERVGVTYKELPGDVAAGDTLRTWSLIVTIFGDLARAPGAEIRGPVLSALAQEIAALSPDATRRAKALLERGWNVSAEESLALEESLQRELLGSPNQAKAVQAGFSGEPAQFDDPE